MSQPKAWSWRQTGERTWQRPLHDIPAIFLQKHDGRVMTTDNGALIHGLPSDSEQRRATILEAWYRLKFVYPVLRVVLGSSVDGDDVLEYESPASDEDMRREAEETMLVHKSWGGVEPFEWIVQIDYPGQPEGKGRLHVFDGGDRDGIFILVEASHALVDGYGGFYMLDKLIEFIAQPSADPSRWGTEAPDNLTQSLDAYSDTLRGGKDISEAAKVEFEKAKEVYGPKGAPSILMPLRHQEESGVHGFYQFVQEWSESDTTTLVNTVKQDGTTVGQVLIGAGLLATYRHILSAPNAQRAADPESRMPGGTTVDMRPFVPDHAKDTVLSNPTIVCPNERELSAAQDRISSKGSASLKPSDLVMPRSESWIKFNKANGLWPAVRATAALDPDLLDVVKAGDRSFSACTILGRIDSILKPRHGHLRVSKPRFTGVTPDPFCAFCACTHENRLTVWLHTPKSHLPFESGKAMSLDFDNMLRAAAGLPNDLK